MRKSNHSTHRIAASSAITLAVILSLPAATSSAWAASTKGAQAINEAGFKAALQGC